MADDAETFPCPFCSLECRTSSTTAAVLVAHVTPLCVMFEVLDAEDFLRTRRHLAAVGKTKKIAPWTPETVAALNSYQTWDIAHPYTSASGRVLIATEAGWVEELGGPVVQDWAHGWHR